MECLNRDVELIDWNMDGHCGAISDVERYFTVEFTDNLLYCGYARNPIAVVYFTCLDAHATILNAERPEIG